MATEKKEQQSSSLDGLKVLDFSTLLPGPYATQILADLGADVLRVEAINRSDLLRIIPPLVDKDVRDVSVAHAALNRNKRSIAMDLKTPEAIAAIKKLVLEYDIVVEQFRPGVMERLGLDYDTLKRINPTLIFCSITGYGQTGPLKDKAGHDINYQALAGLASYSGRKDSGPALHAAQIADVAGGSHLAVMGIQAAVIQRLTTGKGQSIDISMSDGALAMNALFSANTLATGTAPNREGEILNGGGFYDFYETSDGQWLSIGGLEPQFASVFFQTIGHPEWLAQSMDLRAEVQQQLKHDIRAVIRGQNLTDWLNIFGEMDICVEPVLDLDEALEHPHFTARGMVVDVPVTEDSDETLRQLANPIRMSGSVSQYRYAGRRLGADTAQVLSEVGYAEADIAEMRTQKNH